MTKLTNHKSTFEVLLLSKLSKRKGFSIDFFNQFISKDKDGNYINQTLNKEFELWMKEKAANDD